MATDNDSIAENTKEGWNGFCWFIGLSTAGILTALALMAIFLL